MLTRCSMMEGCSVEAKKKLIYLLFQRIESDVGITPVDVEITITEIPLSDIAAMYNSKVTHIALDSRLRGNDSTVW